MKTTASKLIRWAGLSAVVGGTLFVGMQPIHPPEILSSVTTGTWALVHYVGVAMCLLNLVGIAGIYARQVEESGWFGLAGFVLFSLMWVLTAAFQFAEAFILPLLATDAPQFVAGFVGIPGGSASEVSLGILPAVCGEGLREASYGEPGRGGYGLGSLVERRQQSSDIGARDALGHQVAQKITHWWPFVHEDPHIALWLGQGQCTCQRYETSRDVA
jgi:hypothetical protein